MIGPKTWDRIVRIFLRFVEMAVTAQKLGAVWVFNSRIFALNHVLDVNKCREWVVDRSQNMGPNYGDFWAVRDSPETVVD